MRKRLITGFIALLVLGTAAFFGVAAPSALGSRYHEAQISFPTADGLLAGSDVLEAGSKIGYISDIEPTQDNRAVVTVEIAEGHWPLHQGVKADIRPKSLLGEKYVDIHDGPANAVAYNGQTIVADNQAVPVELDQFINSLDPDTRAAARILLNDLGAGLAGQGQDLNQAIAAGRQDLDHLAVTGTTLNNRDADLDRILVTLDDLLSTITTKDQLSQMSQLITHGQETLNAIEQEQQSFSRSYTDANTALAELNTGIGGAVPSLQEALSAGSQLVPNLEAESHLLAELGAEVNTGDVLQVLEQGITHGPTSSGGALEYAPGGKALPIFRICFMTPSPSSCTGSGTFSAPGPQGVPSGYFSEGGGASLASWMGA